jgi:hypothetical protein
MEVSKQLLNLTQILIPERTKIRNNIEILDIITVKLSRFC